MKTYSYSLLAFLCLSLNFSIAQLSVTNDSYIFVDGDGFNSSPSVAPLFVTNDVRIADTDSRIYLRNDAQLLQGNGTTKNSGRGSLSVYQKGTVHNYAYNYWASPVGNVNTDIAANNPFKATASIINEVTNLTNSVSAQLVDGSDGYAGGAGLQIAKSWLWGYSPGQVYADWDYLGDGSNLEAGYGFTMKGSVGSLSQQYDFKGKPNTGTINTAVFKDNYTLVGNPYPSAIDASRYIHDTSNTGVMTGTLYFWEQDLSVSSHVLRNYVGGYATYTINAAGTIESFVPAIFTSLDDNGMPNSAGSASTSGKAVKRFIPIAQGFMVKGTTNGNVKIKNSHRVFYKQNEASSEFFKTESPDSNLDDDDSFYEIEYDENGFQIFPESTELKRFRLNVDFNNVFTRQLLHNFTPEATSGFDYGLESDNKTPNANDAYFILEKMPYITQANKFAPELKIPLVLVVNETTPLTIRILDVQNFKDETIYIHDTETDVYYNLMQQDFEVNLAPGTHAKRYEVTFKNNTKLKEEVEETETEEVSKISVFQDNNLAQLVITNPNALDISSFNLIDASGKQVIQNPQLNSQERYQFSTSNLTPGVYISMITLSDNSVVSKKVVINN